MSVAMRLPSRIGTRSLRSMMARDSSSFSVACRAAICCGVGGPPGWAWAQGLVMTIAAARNRSVAFAFMVDLAIQIVHLPEAEPGGSARARAPAPLGLWELHAARSVLSD